MSVPAQRPTSSSTVRAVTAPRLNPAATPALVFMRSLARAGRNAGPEMLVEWLDDGRLPFDDLHRVITDVWSMAEWPASALGIDVWVELFSVCGFVSDDGQPRPTEAVVAYRGATLKHASGMSWTIDFDRAVWFAQRARNAGLEAFVFRREIPPAAILAICGMERGRNEREVVVDPEVLPPISARCVVWPSQV